MERSPTRAADRCSLQCRHRTNWYVDGFSLWRTFIIIKTCLHHRYLHHNWHLHSASGSIRRYRHSRHRREDPLSTRSQYSDARSVCLLLSGATGVCHVQWLSPDDWSVAFRRRRTVWRRRVRRRGRERCGRSRTLSRRTTPTTDDVRCVTVMNPIFSKQNSTKVIKLCLLKWSFICPLLITPLLYLTK